MDAEEGAGASETGLPRGGVTPPGGAQAPGGQGAPGLDPTDDYVLLPEVLICGRRFPALWPGARQALRLAFPALCRFLIWAGPLLYVRRNWGGRKQ